MTADPPEPQAHSYTIGVNVEAGLQVVWCGT
jgi:hypothetical protein